jgi:chaperonin GroEL (HSP60 family)
MATVTDVRFGAAGRERIAQGVDTLANAVKATLGPKGRCVLNTTEVVVYEKVEPKRRAAGGYGDEAEFS